MHTSAHLALTLALLGAARAGAADNDLERLLGLLAERARGHVSYVEHDYLGVLERPLESSGELFYERPNRVEKRTLAPRPASVILENGTLTLQSGRRKRVLALRDFPQIAPLIESMRATLAGDRAALEQVFEVSFQGNLARWTLTLAPRDTKAKSVVRQIRIEGARDELQSVNILQADGDRSVMAIGPTISP